MKTRKELKELSLSSLRGHWGGAVLATFLFFVIAAAYEVPGELFDSPVISSTIMLPLFLFVLCPMTVGLYNTFRQHLEEGQGKFTSGMFSIGFTHYWHNIGGVLLTSIYILLWSLLLIVPGIIKSLSYSMTYFILADEPQLSPEQAIKKSMIMMEGHKMELFLLSLSFIGWILLGIVTLGIGLLWVIPYMYTAVAEFYLELRDAESPVTYAA